MAKKSKGKEVHRSAKTGRFVTASYATRHPSTTVKEQDVSITVPTPPKRTKKKK